MRSAVRGRKNSGFLFPVWLAGVLATGSSVSVGYLRLTGMCEDIGSELKMLETRSEVLD